MTKFALMAAALLLSTATAWADTIDFEAQGLNAPNVFTRYPTAPLTIGTATFAGGQLLSHASGYSPDQSVVYGTFSTLSGFGPITISFSHPVGEVSVLVTNVNPEGSPFSMVDNYGEAASLEVGLNQQAVLALHANEVNSVNISASDVSYWDFSIDDVTFTQWPGLSRTAVPEPSPGIAMLAGLCLFGMGRRWLAAKAGALGG